MSKKKKTKVAYVAVYDVEFTRNRVFVVCKDGGIDNVRLCAKPLVTLNSLVTVYRINLEKALGVVEERRVYIHKSNTVYFIYNAYYTNERGELVKDYGKQLIEVPFEDLYTDETERRIADIRNKIAREIYNIKTAKTAQAHATA